MNNLIKKDLEYRMISRRSNNKEKTMNSMLIHSALALLASAFMVACSGPTEKVERFVYDEKGYPDQNTVENLFEELDYQRAVQAYLWGIAPMTTAGQHKMAEYYGADGNFDFLSIYQDAGNKGQLTPNTIVKYLFSFINLKETGPAVFDWPGGFQVGIILDYDHRYIVDFGLASPAGPSPEKLLLLGPDHEVPEDTEGYRVVKIDTYVPIIGWRVLRPTVDTDIETKVALYPLAERENPKPNKIITIDKDAEIYYMAHPKGMAYWEQLNEYIQREPVKEVDRYFMAFLEPLGIKKGETFEPSPEQIKILEKAAFTGEKMAIATSFATRNKNAVYRDDSEWVHPFMLNPSHKTEFTEQIDERVDWLFEAYGVSPAMRTTRVGIGSIYLSSYRDNNKNWFDGGKSYKMKVAPDAPMKDFWAVTIYDLDTRALIPNETGRSEISSRTEGLAVNEDGSIDLYFGPTAPEGYENNWVQTVPDEYWFTYFRLYAPTEAYFDRSWPMYDIELVKQ